MKIIENTLDFQLNTPTVVAMGKFDGVHVGHSLLLEKAMKKRKAFIHSTTISVKR